MSEKDKGETKEVYMCTGEGGRGSRHLATGR